MSHPRLLIVLAFLIGGYFTAFHQAPADMRTPARVVATAIGRAERAAAADPVRAPGSAAIAPPRDPLIDLIIAHGHPCRAVLVVESTDPAHGIYAVTCRLAGGTQARFSVDARRSLVIPLPS